METKRRNTLILCASLALIFIFSAVLGSGVETVQGRTLVFESVTDGGPARLINEICEAAAVDVIFIMLIGLFSHPAASLCLTAAVTFFRGAVLGCGGALLAANSTSVAGVAYAVSYIAVSMLICGYAVVINRNNLSRLTALCLYGAVSGTAVILRGLALLIT